MNPLESPRHLDTALANLASVLEGIPGIERALLIEDSVGRISLGIWSPIDTAIPEEALAKSGGPFFTGSIFHAQEEANAFLELEDAWRIATRVKIEGKLSNVRRIVRMRTLTSWQYQQKPLWPISDEAPALVTFYSYKGGLGRTTSLVSFAIQRACEGDRVVILDLDLEAPGMDLLARHCEPTPAYGIVDYLLEAPSLETAPDLTDHCATVSHPELVGSGSILVFPAGKQDADYLGKVSRIDMEWQMAREAGFPHPLERLLRQIRDEMQADWILIDSRTGFSEVSGLLLSGFAHLHVLFGVQSQQSWEGLERVVTRLGEERLERDFPQSDTFLVQCMLQDQGSKERFGNRAESVFYDHYYAEEALDDSMLEAREDDALDLMDATGEDAPHRPEGIPYLPAFSQEVELTDSVKLRALLSGEYRSLADRIARRCGREESNGQD